MSATNLETTFRSKVFQDHDYYLIESTKSNFLTVVVDVPSPMIHVSITVPTTTLNDKGIPHTLEHLIFMGSNEYPYGFLDDYSRKCMTDGTNAWTLPDKTQYTFETVCPQAVYSLLPVYMDHVLRPTLSNESFFSEVCYVDANGEHKGVVFTEMVDRTNSSADLMERTAQSALFSSECPYAFETGGIPKDITTLTNEEIKQYHAINYTWDRLSLTITGSGIDRQRIESIISAMETKYQDGTPTTKGAIPVHHKTLEVPTQLIPLTEGGQVLEVPFPSADLDSCEVGIYWRGPLGDATHLVDRLCVLSDYMTGDTTAALTQFLVYKKQVCGDVSFHADKFSTSKLCWSFEDVPVDKKHELVALLHNELQRIADEDLNEDRLKDCIESTLHDFRRAWEGAPHELLHEEISDWAVLDVEGGDLRDPSRCLDSEHLSGLENRLDFKSRYESLVNTSLDQWRDILRTWFINIDVCVVMAVPSEIRESEIAQEYETMRDHNLATLTPEELAQYERCVHGDLKRNKSESNKMLEKMPSLNPNEVNLNIFQFPTYSNLTLTPNKVTSIPETISRINKDVSEDRCRDLNAFLDNCSIPIVLSHVDCTRFSHLKFVLSTPRELWGTDEQLGLETPKLEIDNQKNGMINTMRTAGTKEQLDQSRPRLPPIGSSYLSAAINYEVERGESTRADGGKLAAFWPHLLFDLPLTDGTSHDLLVARLSGINAEFDASLGMGGSEFSVGHGPNTFVASLDCPDQHAIKGAHLLAQSIFMPKLTKSRLKEIAEPVHFSAARQRVEAHTRMLDVERSIMFPGRDPSIAASANKQYHLTKSILKNPGDYVKRLSALWDDVVFGKDVKNLDSYFQLCNDSNDTGLVLHISMNLDVDGVTDVLDAIVKSIVSVMRQSLKIKYQDGGLVSQLIPKSVTTATKKGFKMGASIYSNASANLSPKVKAKQQLKKQDKERSMRIKQRDWDMGHQEPITAAFSNEPTKSLGEMYAVIPKAFRYRRYRPSENGTLDMDNRIITSIDGSSSTHYHHVIKLTEGDVCLKRDIALLVMTNYLSYPLFEAVRDAGYSYGIFLYMSSDFSQLRLEITPASDMPNAILATFTLLKKLVHARELSESHDEALRRGQTGSICQLLSRQGTISAALQQQSINAICGRSNDTMLQQLMDIQHLSSKQMIDLSIKLLSKFFEERDSPLDDEGSVTSMASSIMAPVRSKQRARTVHEMIVMITNPSNAESLNASMAQVMDEMDLGTCTLRTKQQVDGLLDTGKITDIDSLAPLEIVEEPGYDYESYSEEYASE